MLWKMRKEREKEMKEEMVNKQERMIWVTFQRRYPKYPGLH